MRVLVTGANGKTGRAVSAALAARGAQVRAFIRDPAQWPALQALGHAHDHVLGDLKDSDDICSALQGCDAIVHVGPPMHPQEVSMTRNCLAAAQRCGLSHFVYYSVMHTLRRDVRHHRLKLDCEEMLVGSGLAYTIVQPIRYMQHLEPIWKQVTEQGVHAMPFNVDVKFNVADLLDHAAATAAVVTESAASAPEPGRHCFAIYELAGPEALSQTDMAAIISRVIGRTVTARAVPLRARAAAADHSADRVAQMLAMNAHYDQHGFRGNPNVLRMLLGREPTRFEDYVRSLWANKGKPA
jgi:uncharacterized protein YbjT (DUF2867 family)